MEDEDGLLDLTAWGWSVERPQVRGDDDRNPRGLMDDSTHCVRGHEYPEDVEIEDRWKVCPECKAENEFKIRLQIETAKQRYR